MLDTEQQLRLLKQRVAAIDRKFTETRAARLNRQENPVPQPDLRPSNRRFAESFIDEWSEGSVVQNRSGQHFQTERLYGRHKSHGSADIGALTELPSNLLDALSGGDIPDASPRRWAFLDTETTGLAGGSGTYAFLIGVGRITDDGFRVRQFFMREYAEEPSVLQALEEHLADFDVLVTYNGKSYDQPLLETRFRMTRRPPPFSRLPHLDLLYGARRLWKLRLEGCRLIHLEQQILGFQREGDVPGELIPYIYFEYLRSREACRVAPILHHNAIDILTLACLTAIVPAAFRTSDPGTLRRLGIRRGEDLVGVGRWLLAAGEPERALEFWRESVERGLPDHLLFRTLWEMAALEKKQGRPDAALALFTEVASCSNDYRVASLVELAKFYEHDQRNYALALDFARQALQHEQSEPLLRRCVRLERRLQKPRPRRLALS